jgi:hypothetical protein
LSTNEDFNIDTNTNTNTNTNIEMPDKKEEQKIEEPKEEKEEGLYDNIAPPPPTKKIKRWYGGRQKKISKAQQRLQWRRNSLMSHLVRGLNLNEISNLMHIPYRTLYDDYQVLQKEARENIENGVLVKNLPFEIQKAVDGLNDVVKILYGIQDLNTMHAENRRTADHTRVLALNSIAACIEKKLEILTSQGAIEAAMRFVDSTQKSQMVRDYKSEVDRIAAQDKQESFAIMDAVTNEEVNAVTINNSSVDYNNSNNTVATVDSSSELEEEAGEGAGAEEQDQDSDSDSSSDGNSNVV